MPDLKFAYEGHLGGCVLPTPDAPNGDPATWCPGVWDWLRQTEQFEEVLDVGCGAGFAIKYFDNMEGVFANGIEGCQEAIDNAVISNSSKIYKHDFRNGPWLYFRKSMIGLVWCCEVAEHIDPECEEAFLETLALGRVIAMTHGLPGQGGHHHVNLQHPSYWIAKLQSRGYTLDVQQTRQCRLIARIEGGDDHHFNRTGLVFRKVLPSSPSYLDAMLTWASGDRCCDSPEMTVFLESLQGNFCGKKVAFTNDMSIDARERFEDAGFEVVDVNPNDVTWVVRDRFKAYANWIKTNPSYDRIFLVDSRDILFQGDINAWFDEYTKKQEGLGALRQTNFGVKPSYMYLMSEGHKHADSTWNIQDQENMQAVWRRDRSGVIGSKFKRWPILNGGFQVGTPDMIENLCNEIYDATDYVDQPMRPTDQAALNFLHYHLNYFGNAVKIIDPKKDDLILHGEPIHTGVMAPPDYKKYLVFHQWDRTQFRDEILDQYGD